MLRWFSVRLLFAGLPTLFVFAGFAPAQDSLIQHPFYPLKVGHQWTYRSGKEQVVVQVEKEVPLEFKRDDKAERSEKAVGAQLKITSGSREVTETVAVLSDGVYKFTTAGKTLKPPLRFFKFPLDPVKKEEWKIDSKTDDGKLRQGRFISGTDTLKLAINGKPAEDVDTVTITSADFRGDGQDLAVKFWFARGLGVVRQQVRIGKTEMTLELEQFKAGK